MMPQSVWCRITRCPLLGGWPWLSRPSRAHERSVAGVIRPPMLRITTASPSSRPRTSPGSTRESTQPSTCRVSLVGKGRPTNAPVAANAALRRTRSSEEMIMSSERTRRRMFHKDWGSGQLLPSEEALGYEAEDQGVGDQHQERCHRREAHVHRDLHRLYRRAERGVVADVL